MARARLGAEPGGAYAIDVHERAAEAIVCMLDVLGYEAEGSDASHRPFAIRVLTGPGPGDTVGRRDSAL